MKVEICPICGDGNLANVYNEGGVDGRAKVCFVCHNIVIPLITPRSIPSPAKGVTAKQITLLERR